MWWKSKRTDKNNKIAILLMPAFFAANRPYSHIGLYRYRQPSMTVYTLESRWHFLVPKLFVWWLLPAAKEKGTFFLLGLFWFLRLEATRLPSPSFAGLSFILSFRFRLLLCRMVFSLIHFDIGFSASLRMQHLQPFLRFIAISKVSSPSPSLISLFEGE